MKTIIVILVLMLVGCGKESVVEPVTDNVVNRYAATTVLGAGEEVTINGAVVGFNGWSNVEVHSTGTIELRFNSQETILELTDFVLAGTRVENMELINHGNGSVTIRTIIKTN